MSGITIIPRTQFEIDVKSSGGNNVSNSMPRVVMNVIAIKSGTMTLSFDFPQLDDKDRKTARNVITVYDDGTMEAKQCVPEKM